MLFTFTLPCIVLEQAYCNPDSAISITQQCESCPATLVRQYQKPAEQKPISFNIFCFRILAPRWRQVLLSAWIFSCATIVQLKAIAKCSRLWIIQVQFISSLFSFCSFQSKHWRGVFMKLKHILWIKSLHLAFSLFNIKMVHIILRQSNAIIKRQIRTLEF